MPAITRGPSPNMQACPRTYVDHAAIDLSLAIAQHANYCRLLTRCGASVVTLPPIAGLPDSTFVEDTALVLDELAIILPMGLESRRGEPQHIQQALVRHRPLERIAMPATIDGGDVLQLGRTLFIGRSCRTNDRAIAAVGSIGKRHGYDVVPIPVTGCLHLKTVARRCRMAA